MRLDVGVAQRYVLVAQCTALLHSGSPQKTMKQVGHGQDQWICWYSAILTCSEQDQKKIPSFHWTVVLSEECLHDLGQEEVFVLE